MHSLLHGAGLAYKLSDRLLSALLIRLFLVSKAEPGQWNNTDKCCSKRCFQDVVSMALFQRTIQPKKAFRVTAPYSILSGTTCKQPGALPYISCQSKFYSLDNPDAHLGVGKCTVARGSWSSLASFDNLHDCSKGSLKQFMWESHHAKRATSVLRAPPMRPLLAKPIPEANCPLRLVGGPQKSFSVGIQDPGVIDQYLLPIHYVPHQHFPVANTGLWRQQRFCFKQSMLCLVSI